MKPANEQRDAILADFNRSGARAMDKAALDGWVDRASSILARWCVEDDMFLDQIKSGEIPPESTVLLHFYQTITAVSIAQRPNFLKLAASAAEHLNIVGDYSEAASQAAQRDAIEGFRAAIRKDEPQMTADRVEHVAMIMAVVMMTKASGLSAQKMERLRAEVIALGGDPDERPD